MPKTQPTLAWQVTIPTNGPTWEMFIDAQSGSVLSEPRDINRYVNGTGQVFNVSAVVATHDNSLRDNADAASAVPSSAYSIVTLAGTGRQWFPRRRIRFQLAHEETRFDATNTFIFDRSNDGFSEVMGYHSFDYAERYIQSLGFTNVNNRQQVFAVNRLKIDNSFYSPNSKEISLGLGGVDDAEDAEVIWHEYGHSIQDDQVPNFGSSLEGGAMGEGFGDYWAGSVGAQLSGGFQDLCVAEWDATSYSSTNPPCLRRLDSTKHYPESVVGQVHADGEMWSASFMADSQRGRCAASGHGDPSGPLPADANCVVQSGRERYCHFGDQPGLHQQPGEGDKKYFVGTWIYCDCVDFSWKSGGKPGTSIICHYKFIICHLWTGTHVGVAAV